MNEGIVYVLINPAMPKLVKIGKTGCDDVEDFVFPSPRRTGHLSRQAIGDVCRKWGRAAGLHVHPHQLRHSHATHAVQRGVDVFTLQATLGQSSSATTGHYVAANPRDSSSLRLGWCSSLMCNWAGITDDKRSLRLQQIEVVLPPHVLHEVDSLRTFSEKCPPSTEGDVRINFPNEICRRVEA